MVRKLPEEGTSGPQRPRPFLFEVSLLCDVAADSARREAEWRLVFDHFNPRLRDFFSHRLDDEDELDDLMAELWRRALFGIHRLQSPLAAWSWLVQIGTNLLRDQGRTKNRRGGDPVRLDVLSAGELGRRIAPYLVDGTLALDGNDSLFGDLLAGIVPRDLELLQLHYVDERGYDEIAAILHLPSAAACRKRMQRLRKLILDRWQQIVVSNRA